ncbi:hypothetical protein FUA23_19595 [Neolewinella aurantiaca]|uniref:Tail specific protease domain-containing protein n=1 Tax=Neolewinella aurantiaca TaxID=2602767 RepID=A0A5C7FNN2_9BACT|nr:S41 family peptidase [Neolewinella aurantiaca]TXF86325.1 hypothetical protein FUA23_19595 [Neolewinella aurantiaca]
MKNVLTFLLLCCFPFFGSAQDLTKTIVGQDMARIIRAFEIYHTNAYHYADSAAIAAYRDELLAALPAAPTKMEAYRALNQLVCAFGDGHSRLWDQEVRTAYQSAGGTYFPLAIDVRENGLFVRRAFGAAGEDLVGQEITAINGRPGHEITAALSAHASRETPALDRVLLSNDFPRYFWLAYGDGPVAYNITLNDGSVRSLQGVERAATLRKDTDGPVVETKLLTDEVAYLRIRHFEGAPKTFGGYFKDAFETINDSGAKSLILDLRGHDGGDSRVGARLARYLSPEPFRTFAYSEWKVTPAFRENFKNLYLPGGVQWAMPVLKLLNPHLKAIFSATDNENARVEYPIIKPYGQARAFSGEVILLMDGNTFSAGTCFAALFKDYRMGTIIGQESGNLANFHADGLIRVGLESFRGNVQISNSYLVRPNGNEAATPVQPDIALDPATDALSYALEHLVGRNAAARRRCAFSGKTVFAPASAPDDCWHCPGAD